MTYPPTGAPHDDITDVPGIEVGQWTDPEAATGCTVVLARQGAVGGFDLRGGAPGTREIAVLDPANTVERVHAVVLAGGSAFGLEAATGVVRWLEERGIGYRTVAATVPIVVSAILHDLGLGRSDRRPTADDGYAAAGRAGRVALEQGSVGAGTGATVGKLLGQERCIKGGLGSASVRLYSGHTVGALVALNSIGEIVDPATGAVIAGPRADEPGRFESSVDLLREGRVVSPLSANATTLVCVATDAPLSKPQARRVAMVAHTGVARTVRPAHLSGDGDALFVLSTADEGQPPCDRQTATAVGALAADAVERAVLKAVLLASGSHGVPSANEWRS